MPSREYKVLVVMFQRLLNRANIINSKEHGIYDDEISLKLLTNFVIAAKHFIKTSEDQEEVKKIKMLIGACHIVKEETGKIGKESLTAFRLATR